MRSLHAEGATGPQNDWQCPSCRLATRAREGMFSLPNNPLIVATLQALCAGGARAQSNDGGWRSSREGTPYFDFWSGSGGRIRVTVGEADPIEAWEHIHSYSALTLDVAMSLLAGLACDAHRTATVAPRRDSVRLSAAAVLNAKKYRRFGAERIQFANSVELEMAKLLRLRFDIINYPAFNPTTRSWARMGITRQDVALLECAPDSPPPDANECQRGLALRFGAWAEHWLHAGGPMWVSPLPQAVLCLDHRDNRGADVLAKKIGLLLALSWGAARHNDSSVLEVRALLRRVGELRRCGADTAHYSGRLADRTEEALMRLSESGLFEIRLAGHDAAATLRAGGRRWFDSWLDARLTISQPGFIQASIRAAAS